MTISLQFKYQVSKKKARLIFIFKTRLKIKRIFSNRTRTQKHNSSAVFQHNNNAKSNHRPATTRLSARLRLVLLHSNRRAIPAFAGLCCARLWLLDRQCHVFCYILQVVGPETTGSIALSFFIFNKEIKVKFLRAL